MTLQLNEPAVPTPTSTKKIVKVTVLEPTAKHQQTCIMLHGRGSDGEEFSRELFETHFSSGETLRELLPGCRWVFPSSGMKYAAVFEEDVNQWFDMYSLTNPEAESETQVDGIRESVAEIRELIARESALSPTADVILGGISQGFATAVLVALHHEPRVRAVIGFSSWLPFKSVIVQCMNDEVVLQKFDGNLRQAVYKTLAAITSPSSKINAKGTCKSIPVFIGHCVNDNMVEVKHGREMRDVLIRMGHQVQWRESPGGGHWINEPHGMNGLKAFLWSHDLVNTRLSFVPNPDPYLSRQ